MANRSIKQFFDVGFGKVPRCLLRFMCLMPWEGGSVHQLKDYICEHHGFIVPIVKTHSLVKVNPVFNIWYR